MKLEENMYVRSKNGKIRKIISLSFDKAWKSVFVDTHTWLKAENIAKASHNIIDLIEVGDYVNGHRIVKIFSNKFNGKKLLIALDREEDYKYSDKLEDYMGEDSIHIFEEDIKTILTKEQFEKRCYKIEN